VAGTIYFSEVSVLAYLASLAAAAVSLFAVSTFDTDYLQVKEKDFEKAVDVLTRQGTLLGVCSAPASRR
jgi:hypothetical protein